MSINVILKLTAKPGQGGVIADHVAEMLKDTRKFKGYEKINLYTVEGQPETLLLVEQWETAEDYDAYRTWREEGSGIELVEMLAQPIEFMWLRDAEA